jgi:hypothetical protein
MEFSVLVFPTNKMDFNDGQHQHNIGHRGMRLQSCNSYYLVTLSLPHNKAHPKRMNLDHGLL